MHSPRFTRRFRQTENRIENMGGIKKKNILTSKWKKWINGWNLNQSSLSNRSQDGSHVCILDRTNIEPDRNIAFYNSPDFSQVWNAKQPTQFDTIPFLWHTDILRNWEISDLSASSLLQLHSLFYTWLTT